MSPFYAYQAILGLFLAYQAFLCLSAHQDLLMLVRPFYAYQRTRGLLCLSGLFMFISRQVAPICAYQCGKKIKSTYLETTVFSRAVCPVQVFAPAEKSDGTF
jgi:hypothetical protein